MERLRLWYKVTLCLQIQELKLCETSSGSIYHAAYLSHGSRMKADCESSSLQILKFLHSNLAYFPALYGIPSYKALWSQNANINIYFIFVVFSVFYTKSLKNCVWQDIDLSLINFGYTPHMHFWYSQNSIHLHKRKKPAVTYIIVHISSFKNDFSRLKPNNSYGLLSWTSERITWKVSALSSSRKVPAIGIRIQRVNFPRYHLWHSRWFYCSPDILFSFKELLLLNFSW